MDERVSSDLSIFLSKVRSSLLAIANAKRIYQERLAPDFSPFEFVGASELQLSKIIAWLLDAKGSHSQRGRFLLLFTELIGNPWPEEVCDNSIIETEFPVGDGRLDIRVQAKDRVMVLENKPYAGDQYEQLKRYFSYLDDLRDETMLVYLTSDGSRPSESSLIKDELDRRLEANQLKLIGYGNEIAKWLEDCRQACRADRVTIFIEEFAKLNRRLQTGIAEMTDLNHLVDEITDSEENIESAIRVIAAESAIKERLTSKLKEQVEKRLRPEWELRWDAGPQRWAGVDIDYDPYLPCYFRLEWAQRNYNDLHFGIYKRDRTKSIDARLRDTIVQQYGEGGGGAADSQYWLWSRPAGTLSLLGIAPNWGTDPSPWVNIPNEQVAESIYKIASQFGALLERLQSQKN